LLGPLYAAAVILDADRPIRGLDDSKKLSPKERERLAVEIRCKALAWHVVAVSAAEVDALNVYEASRQAMLLALAGLCPKPQCVLTDAMPLAPVDGWMAQVPCWPIIHGDARCASIAAASILAKVARDSYMRRLDRLYPHYDLAKNKGYGTARHLAALRQFGPCPEHRRTYQPIRGSWLPLFSK
jgi:ribonuclease HII